jgi:ribonuclease R
MVAANESVAGWLVDRGLPGVFRVHPSPGPDAAVALEAFCAAAATTRASAGRSRRSGCRRCRRSSTRPRTTRPRRCGTCCSASWAGRPTHRTPGSTSAGFTGLRALHQPAAPLRRPHRAPRRARLPGRRAEPSAYPSHGELADLCAHLDASTRTAATAERQMRKSLWLVALARQVAEDSGTRFPGRVTGVGPRAYSSRSTARTSAGW